MGLESCLDNLVECHDTVRMGLRDHFGLHTIFISNSRDEEIPALMARTNQKTLFTQQKCMSFCVCVRVGLLSHMHGSLPPV